jgi:hypothetical protein
MGFERFYVEKQDFNQVDVKRRNFYLKMTFLKILVE